MDEALKVYADPTSWPKQLKGPLREAVEDCRWFARLAQQLQLGDRWRQLAETWEGFCQDRLGYPAEFVDAVIAGVQALGEQAPIPIHKAADEGRRVRAEKRAQEIKQAEELVEQQGMSLRQAAKVMGRHHATVSKRLDKKPVMTKKLSTERKPVLQINLATDPSVAAKKIRDKFGEQFARELKEAL